MQPSQALINKSPWVAVYPAFFLNPINVYQTRGVCQTSCPLRSTSSPWKPAAVAWNSHGSVRPNSAALPGFYSPVCTGGRDNSHPEQSEDAAMLGSIMVLYRDSHVEKRGPCDGPDNKLEALQLVHMNACKHA